MSSFIMKARNKRTGVVHDISCMDDYFGKHKYGYVPPGRRAMTEEQFYRKYELEKPDVEV